MSTTPKPSDDPDKRPRARVIGVKESLVAIEVSDGIVMKNEVGFIELGEERLLAEVLRISGKTADMQVFEDTNGVSVGDPVSLSGHMLSATLGPGLLGTVFDGLQNPLGAIADRYGFFLPRGSDVPHLDPARQWAFSATVGVGATCAPGTPVGMVRENHFDHKIMVPFDLREPVTVTWIHEGMATADTTVARVKKKDGNELEIKLARAWPVRRPIPEGLLGRRDAERLYPDKPLTTTIRIIDTFYPVARGGMACIPGPFGAGKTVLQSLIARYSDVDIVIVVACGERAGEVVETITEFPKTADPKTGGSLMDRTIIICNTSAMPVAAREASIYTGVTVGEYYRSMGYDVLLIADSTSRWAQAMRETSGRMEEIPGEEAFPAYLDSSIKGIYERGGVIRNPDGATGSLTLVGTVSPAGGNFEEPVTQATLATVKTFLGLSSDRAYRRCYPAIDPLISWSRYLDQLDPWFEKNLRPQWSADVKAAQELLVRGDTINQMMAVTGEEGITLDDFVTWQKSILLDTVFLQQDAFDPVDVSVPRQRQLESFEFVRDLVTRTYDFPDKDTARNYFTTVMGLYKNLNYSPTDSPDFTRYRDEISAKAAEFSPGA